MIVAMLGWWMSVMIGLGGFNQVYAVRGPFVDRTACIEAISLYSSGYPHVETTIPMPRNHETMLSMSCYQGDHLARPKPVR